MFAMAESVKIAENSIILISDQKVYKKSSEIPNKWILRRFFVYTFIRD